MKTDNQFYYMVGLSGSGKTTVCEQLVTGQEEQQCFASSSRLGSFLKQQESNWQEFNELSQERRDHVIDEFHKTCITDKQNCKLTIADGHMWVANPIQGGMWNAMANDNDDVSDGLIYLNTSCETIVEQVRQDNETDKRLRPTKSLSELQKLAEEEFSAAEDYCSERGLNFGVLLNRGWNVIHRFEDIRFLSDYYLPQDEQFRADYHQQFETTLTASQLRSLHQIIGKKLFKAFVSKHAINNEDWQVLAIPRSANMLAIGFTDSFNGPLLFEERQDNSIQGFGVQRNLVIVDSVIHSGATLERVLEKVPKGYEGEIHVVCLAINIGALGLLDRLTSRVKFHCCGFSNKEERPVGERDMGARLFGTNE